MGIIDNRFASAGLQGILSRIFFVHFLLLIWYYFQKWNYISHWYIKSYKVLFTNIIFIVIPIKTSENNDRSIHKKINLILLKTWWLCKKYDVVSTCKIISYNKIVLGEAVKSMIFIVLCFLQRHFFYEKIMHNRYYFNIKSNF